MHLTETMFLDCAPAAVFPLVSDLTRYPSWMRLVHRAEPEPDSDPPAWSCELRAKVGPFARSKRLRMIRSEFEQDRHVAFERAETDGRSHARWAMRVTTEAAAHDSDNDDGHDDKHREGHEASGTKLTIELIYSGELWTGGLLDRILDDEVQRGREGLQRAVEAQPA